MQIIWKDSTYIANINGVDYQFLYGETYDLPDDNEFLNLWLKGRTWIDADSADNADKEENEITELPEKISEPEPITVSNREITLVDPDESKVINKE